MHRSNQLNFPAADNERIHDREAVAYAGTVRELGSVATAVRLVDLSKAGCRFAGADLRRNDEVWLRIGTLPPLRARIIWARNGEAGCVFYRPLTPVERVSLSSGRQQRAPLFVAPAKRRS